MKDEDEDVATEEIPAEGEPIEDPPAEEVTEPEPNLDNEARKQGWVPKDEFYGNPDEWRDSKEFVARGKEILSHVKQGYDKRISAMETDAEEQQRDFAQRIERMERMNKAALTTQAEQIKTEFSAKKLAAVRDMDEEAHTAAEEGEQEALEKMRLQVAEASRATPPSGPRISRADQAVISEWMNENQWFNSDRVLNAAGDEHFNTINADMPGASMLVRLEEVKRRVTADFPKKFGIKQNGQNRVERGGRQSGGGSGKAKYASLPKEAMKAFAEMKDLGVYEDKDKEEYAAAYFED